MKDNKVAEVAITSNQIQGRMKSETGEGKGEAFKTVRVDPEITDLLEKYDILFKGQIESTFLRDLFSWIFPILIFIAIWYFIVKRIAGQQPGFMSLGRNKAKIDME